MNWLLRQRHVGGVRLAGKQRDGYGRQQRREERIQMGRRGGVVSRGIVAVLLAGFLARRLVVVRLERRRFRQRVAGDDEARDARDAVLLRGPGSLAEEPFHEEGEGQGVGVVAGDGEAADESEFGALVGSRFRGGLVLPGAGLCGDVVALPALRLASEVRDLEVDDFEVAVGVLGAHDGDDAAGHEHLGLEEGADEAEAAGFVFEHDLVEAVGGEVLFAGWGCGDPVLELIGCVSLDNGSILDGGRAGRTTDVFGYVVEDVRFQRHVHVHRPSNPAELALPNVEDTVYAADDIACYLSVTRISLRRWRYWKGFEPYLHSIPCFYSKLFDGRLELGQP